MAAAAAARAGVLGAWFPPAVEIPLLAAIIDVKGVDMLFVVVVIGGVAEVTAEAVVMLDEDAAVAAVVTGGGRCLFFSFVISTKAELRIRAPARRTKC